MLVTLGATVVGVAVVVIFVLWVVPWWQHGRTRREFKALERRRRREYARLNKQPPERQLDDAQA